MNSNLRRRMGSELFGQFKRVRIMSHTDRGEIDVTKGEPRIFKLSWKNAAIGFSDEPWDQFSGKLRFNAIIGLEKIGGTSADLQLPNWWICSVGLQGWYAQDVYIDDKIVLSKPQTDPWNNLGKPEPAYILWKLGEHTGLHSPRNLQLWSLRSKLRLLN